MEKWRGLYTLDVERLNNKIFQWSHALHEREGKTENEYKRWETEVNMEMENLDHKDWFVPFAKCKRY